MHLKFHFQFGPGKPFSEIGAKKRAPLSLRIERHTSRFEINWQLNGQLASGTGSINIADPTAVALLMLNIAPNKPRRKTV